jgi:hypothetical protein
MLTTYTVLLELLGSSTGKHRFDGSPCVSSVRVQLVQAFKPLLIHSSYVTGLVRNVMQPDKRV